MGARNSGVLPAGAEARELRRSPGAQARQQVTLGVTWSNVIRRRRREWKQCLAEKNEGAPVPNSVACLMTFDDPSAGEASRNAARGGVCSARGLTNPAGHRAGALALPASMVIVQARRARARDGSLSVVRGQQSIVPHCSFRTGGQAASSGGKLLLGRAWRAGDWEQKGVDCSMSANTHAGGSAEPTLTVEERPPVRAKPATSKTRVLGESPVHANVLSVFAPAFLAWPRVGFPLFLFADAGSPLAVTGGGGFLGSHLVDYLMARGDHVRSQPFSRLITFDCPVRRSGADVCTQTAGHCS